MAFRSSGMQFNVPAATIGVVLFSAAVYLVAHSSIARQWRGIQRIESAGGVVLKAPTSPAWLRDTACRKVVDWVFVRPYSVFVPKQFKDEDLAILRAFHDLEFVSLEGAEAVTDRGLEYLHNLSDLRIVYVRSTKVTDDGIRQLKAQLPSLIVSQ